MEDGGPAGGYTRKATETGTIENVKNKNGDEVVLEVVRRPDHLGGFLADSILTVRRPIGDLMFHNNSEHGGWSGYKLDPFSDIDANLRNLYLNFLEKQKKKANK